MDELRRQAERKASFKMYYAAADVFRDYKGPFANETAPDRKKLAAEYEQQGRVAEEARWGGGSGTTAARPVGAVDCPVPAPAHVPPPLRPVVQDIQPRPATVAPAASKGQSPIKVEGGRITLACRWCKEMISVEISNAGKLVSCPKCDLLVSVPKP